MKTSLEDGESLGLPGIREPFRMERREFIKLIGEGIIIFFAVENAADALAWQQGARRSPPEDFNAYIMIGPDGRVACFSGKVEFGRGVSTSLAQICAEELEVPFSSVDMIMSDTDRCPWDGGTNGSRSIKYFGPLLRAAAEAREVLIQLAATQAIRFKGGAISHSNSDSYEIPRFSWVPVIETIPVNPELPPQGGGEPSVTCMGGMMANALFDAVGVKLKQLPLTAERVKAGLAS